MNDLSGGMKAALGILAVIFAYMIAVTFLTIPESGIKLADTIVPYLLGIIGVMIGYYWGSSSRGTEPLTPVQSAAVQAAEVKAEKVIEADKPLKNEGGENV